jgi:hypothetical protein
MRHQIHREELMNPDLLSEAVLIGSVLLIVVGLLFFLLQAQA